MNYLDERDRIYSKNGYQTEDPMVDNNIDQNSQEQIGDNESQYLPPKVLDSKNLFGKFKSKLSVFRSGVDEADSSGLATTRQLQLWKIIRDRPFENKTSDDNMEETPSPKKDGKQAESANTFLTENGNDEYEPGANISNSPKKRSNFEMAARQNTLPSIPLSGSPLLSTSETDFIGLEGTASEFITDLDNFSYKVSLRRRNSLGAIQKRLNSIAAKKSDVWKSYQKLLRELHDWSSSAVDTEEGLSLVSDLQRLFYQDLILENRMSLKLREVSKGLEYTKLREDEMLQERKELHIEKKRYEQARNRRGDRNEETSFLKEKVITRQNSLNVIAGHYRQSLSTTARELFVNASVEFYESSSDIKEASRTFFKNSVEYLRSINANDIEQHIEDLRRRRADKHWAKLSSEEKNDPNRLAEVMGAMYNGADSLMRCVGRKQAIKFSPVSVTNEENRADPRIIQEPRLEFKTGLEDTLSGIPTERFNGITSNEYFDKRISEDNTIKIQAGKPQPFKKATNDLRRTLKNNMHLPSLSQPQIVSSDNYGEIKHNSNLSGTHLISKKFPIRLGVESSGNQGINIHDEDGEDNVVINFGNNDVRELSDGFYEAEHELNQNKWVEASEV